MRERVDSTVNKSRAIVRGDDMNALGQARLELLNLVLDAFRHREWILTVPHEHSAARHFVAVLFKHAAAKLSAQLHRCNRLDVNRRSVDLLYNSVFDIILVL